MCGLTETALNPGLARCYTAGLFDLEPLGLGRVEIVAGLAPTGSHVGHHGAGVVRPLYEKKNEFSVLKARKKGREQDKNVQESRLHRAIRRRAYHQA